jgi:hypothetical protein
MSTTDRTQANSATLAGYLAERTPDHEGDMAVIFTSGQRDLLVEAVNSSAPLKARIAELEANEKAYEEIIGKKTYREVADLIGELESELASERRK